MDRVGGAPVLLLDERPLHPGEALAAALAGVEGTGQAGGERLALDLLDDVVGEPAPQRLRLLLERDQHVLGEAAGALLDRERLLVEVERKARGSGWVG